MSKPVERASQLLDQIIAPFDLSHDFGRKQAYEAAIDYAREHLVDDPSCDAFLALAAERLGFAPISFDHLENRVKLPKGAWLDIWIADDDDEVAITGTNEGLQYLVELLNQLRRSTNREQHIHLDRVYLPLTEQSASLVLFKEEEAWFTGGPLAEGDQYPQREIDPKTIYAIQFIHYPPDDLPITAQKLYRVTAVEEPPADEVNLKEFPEGSTDRYRKITFVADTGERFTYAFHLDDPGVNYFTHREIVSLALRPL
ncbi:MAG: Imm32 family immunity protein [Thermoanaerobaculia bacterium]